MKTVGIFLPHPPYVEELFNEAKKKLNFREEINILYADGEKSITEILKKAEVVISGPIKEDQLVNAKNLKLIQVPFAGVDSFDLELIKRLGIILANSHGNALSVAEHAFGLLIALAKEIVRNDRDLRKGYWHGWMSREPNLELEGKTVCIVGLGSIGKEIARFAKAFGMTVIGVKRTVEPVENADEIYPSDQLEKAIEKAQFIVLAVPTTKETKGLINKAILEKMKEKFLINVGRGSVIDEEALFLALKNNVLKGAAIDTWWIYPQKPYQFTYPSHYPFWLLNNIIISSHTAGYSDGSIRKNWKESIENVINFLAGNKIKNIIDLERGY